VLPGDVCDLVGWLAFDSRLGSVTYTSVMTVWLAVCVKFTYRVYGAIRVSDHTHFILGEGDASVGWGPGVSCGEMPIWLLLGQRSVHRARTQMAQHGGPA
jgi:hypothetical protein